MANGTPRVPRELWRGNTGSFGQENYIRCTVQRCRRTGQPCTQPAVKDSPSQKCRMHGGKSLRGSEVATFKNGRYSKYLPSQLDELYREALADPDLLELGDHIALLEGRIKEVLAAHAEGEPVPRWSDLREQFDALATSILGGNQEEINAGLAAVFETLDAGAKWDSTWDQVLAAMEQLRKLSDTEIKRKKDLNQMVPIERVVVLMAAVGHAVKRNVTNPEEVQAVYRELATLHSGGGPGRERLPPGVIDIPAATQRRKEKKKRDKEMDAEILAETVQ